MLGMEPFCWILDVVKLLGDRLVPYTYLLESTDSMIIML